ncbi:MAG TPA: serine/threonine-protein kinase [Kofleriaceae bacterium]|nr:serine/threonine-protein kinase [Kofleriaceae bacterium]
MPTEPAASELDMTMSLPPTADGRRPGSASPSSESELAWAQLSVSARVGRNGKFRLEEEIGKGGMGKVFRAQDLSLCRDVAIKFPIPSRSMTSAEVLAQCYREARAIARMDDENIVRIWELDDQGEPPFIAMEYLRGRSLEQILRQGRLADRDIKRVMTQVAKGLGHAHKLGVLHRDLKPSNIFVLDNGNVKLLDFGLARLNNPGAIPVGQADDPGTLQITFPRAGTAPYMAPEQWRGEDADVRTDLWSALVILFHLLSAQFPFASQTAAALRDEIRSSAPPPPLRPLRPDLPPRFLDWFEQAFAKDPSDRCPSAEDFIDGLSLMLEASDPAHDPSSYPRPVEPSKSEFWTGPATARGLVHLASPRSGLPAWSKAALVFLEEDMPSTFGRWGDIPQRTLRAAEVDMDTIQYTLSGDPSDPQWLSREADHLRKLLGTELRKYRHVFIVARDLGMIVAKRVLIDGKDALSSDEAPSSRPNSSLYPFRVRRLIHVTEGTDPMLATRRSGVSRELDDGIREQTETEFLRFVEFLQERELPSPAIHMVSCRLSPSSPWSPRDAALDTFAVVPHLAALLNRREIVLAQESIAQAFELDCANKIQLLVEATYDDPNPAAPMFASAHAGAQSEVYGALLQLCQHAHEQPPCVVVTGDAGVGKSTVLRRLTRRLGSDCLEAPDGDSPLAVFVPLYFAILESEHLLRLDHPDVPHKGEMLHDLVLDWWCQWASGMTFRGAMQRDWVVGRLSSEPTVLILDGADEFLTNHPALGPADFRMLLHYIAQAYAQNPRMSVIVGVRSSQPSLLSMASASRYVYEILRLTPAQAETYFPAARDWVTSVHDAQARSLLLTPLLLAHLDSRIARPLPDQRATRAEILERVLLTIIERSGLPRLLGADHEPVDATQWVLALMLVAWRMFARIRGEIFIGRLLTEAKEAIEAWEGHLERTGSRQEAAHLLSSFALLCDTQNRNALVRRTVLYPTGQDEVRFIHREWQDFLTSKYLAECVRWRYVDELGHRAFTLPTFMTAGEFLGDLRIDLGLVREVERKTEETGKQLIHANFCALLGNSSTPMSGPAMEVIFGDLRRMASLSRLVTIASFGTRVLKNSPHDPSIVDLRRQVVKAFAECARDDGTELFYRSQAWCYLKAFHAALGTPAPDIPWPGLGDREEDERAALELICDLEKSPPEVAPRHRSLQIAWLQIQSMLVLAPHRPISCAHYLYTIVVARRHRVHIAEVSQDLPAIFEDGSPVAAAYKAYTVVPELWTIFQRCRELFHSA